MSNSVYVVFFPEDKKSFVSRVVKILLRIMLKGEAYFTHVGMFITDDETPNTTMGDYYEHTVEGLRAIRMSTVRLREYGAEFLHVGSLNPMITHRLISLTYLMSYLPNTGLYTLLCLLRNRQPFVCTTLVEFVLQLPYSTLIPDYLYEHLDGMQRPYESDL